ncbi:hypothetical protein [Pseudomonas prosekii]|uniref:Uncharacterized protein n=1 Tax=Pseudomonas prosekii TaxID=1148509 RepID=A0A1H1TIK9_9PSED|nr:hypothetical protein [Pseudomonas prosekii]SDS59786.1 hypothetical protein SAMN05216222_1817 [Pseudomonas prosekii]
MAIKPLKLKRYISEDEAAQLLSLLIGEKVSSEDMAGYALEGIIPGYMQFSPVDSETYPDVVFSLADDDRFPEYDKDRGAMQEWLSVIPYPLPYDGWIEDSNGTRWRVLAGRADFGVDEIRPDHYVRVYSPHEICQVAEIMNDPTACPEWPAILHSRGQTWDFYDLYEEELAGKDLPAKTSYVLSPFREFNDYIPTADGRQTLVSTGPIGERNINWQLVVAGLWELLRDDQKKQGAVAAEIGERKWKGARKDDVNHALRIAKQAMETQNQ